MATLQNSVQKCEDLTSFQEIFTTCYSHGLESIYKLENVDLKSVRKLAVVEKSVSIPVKIKEEWLEDQLSLDLGPFYREWITPYLHLEPIHVLQLAKPLEKNLLGLGVKTIGNLNQLDLQTLKLGQGHIEEIRKKLSEYIYNKPLKKTKSLDFLSLIKCVCADKDPCKIFVCLETYGLHEWMHLSPSESMEVKRSLNKSEWVSEMRPVIISAVKPYFPSIVETWVKPWLHRRGGVAHGAEIEEFLVLKSLDPGIAEKALKLFGPMHDSLVEIEGIFALSPAVAKEYELIFQKIKSYFVNPKACYQLCELVNLVAKEFALEWNSVTEAQIQRALNLSCAYKIFRASNGTWLIHLS